MPAFLSGSVKVDFALALLAYFLKVFLIQNRCVHRFKLAKYDVFPSRNFRFHAVAFEFRGGVWFLLLGGRAGTFNALGAGCFNHAMGRTGGLWGFSLLFGAKWRV